MLDDFNDIDIIGYCPTYMMFQAFAAIKIHLIYSDPNDILFTLNT